MYYLIELSQQPDEIDALIIPIFKDENADTQISYINLSKVRQLAYLSQPKAKLLSHQVMAWQVKLEGGNL